jgi:hypothetical protein
VKASASLGRDGIGWRHSKTKIKTIEDSVIVKQLAQANNGMLVGEDAALNMSNTENISDIQNDA